MESKVEYNKSFDLGTVNTGKDERRVLVVEAALELIRASYLGGCKTSYQSLPNVIGEIEKALDK